MPAWPGQGTRSGRASPAGRHPAARGRLAVCRGRRRRPGSRCKPHWRAAAAAPSCCSTRGGSSGPRRSAEGCGGGLRRDGWRSLTIAPPCPAADETHPRGGSSGSAPTRPLGTGNRLQGYAAAMRSASLWECDNAGSLPDLHQGRCHGEAATVEYHGGGPRARRRAAVCACDQAWRPVQRCTTGLHQAVCDIKARNRGDPLHPALPPCAACRRCPVPPPPPGPASH